MSDWLAILLEQAEKKPARLPSGKQSKSEQLTALKGEYYKAFLKIKHLESMVDDLIRENSDLRRQLKDATRD